MSQLGSPRGICVGLRSSPMSVTGLHETQEGTWETALRSIPGGEREGVNGCAAQSSLVDIVFELSGLRRLICCYRHPSSGNWFSELPANHYT